MHNQKHMRAPVEKIFLIPTPSNTGAYKESNLYAYFKTDGRKSHVTRTSSYKAPTLASSRPFQKKKKLPQWSSPIRDAYICQSASLLLSLPHCLV